MFEQTIRLCDSFLDMGIPGYDIAIYKGGQCILRKQNGYSDLENRVPVHGNEVYRFYSCSKPITCTAAMQLWEKGAFHLDDPVSDYLPEYAHMTVQEEDGTLRPAKTVLRIRNLFQMTGGFSYNYKSPKLVELCERTNDMCTTREVIRALAQEPLLFDPGDHYKYSLCHDVLAAVIEVVSGMPFNDYLHKNIFKPLGMNRSTFDLPDEKLDILCPQYKFDPELGRAVCISKEMHRVGKRFVSGGGGCISTVDDYIKFALAMCEGERLLKRETIRRMMTDQLSQKQHPSVESGYGLGVRVPREGSWRKEFGWGGAAGAYVSIDPTNKLVIFYAQQLLNSPNQKIRGRLYRTVMEDLGLPTGATTSAGADDASDPGSFHNLTKI